MQRALTTPGGHPAAPCRHQCCCAEAAGRLAPGALRWQRSSGAGPKDWVEPQPRNSSEVEPAMRPSAGAGYRAQTSARMQGLRATALSSLAQGTKFTGRGHRRPGATRPFAWLLSHAGPRAGPSLAPASPLLILGNARSAVHSDFDMNLNLREGSSRDFRDDSMQTRVSSSVCLISRQAGRVARRGSLARWQCRALPETP